MGTTGERWTLGHRPALDGVRGIAILLVLACHMAIPGMAGAGAVGVAVFFVLSGYLITGLLLDEHERRGRISLRSFYERRARRLLPALLVSTAVVALFGLVLGGWWFEWRNLPPVLLYYSNWAVMDRGGLLSLGGLSGTWSLAIEEQFYIAWPLLLLLVVRCGRRAVAALAVVVAALSLLWRIYLLRTNATTDHLYLGTDTVAMALASGAALVAWQGSKPTRRSAGPLALAGAILILTPATWDLHTASCVALPVAAIGAVLLLAGATTAQPMALLQSRALVWFGQRSYGLYLWHCPLGFLLREHSGWSWPFIVAVMLPASLIMAEASYRWIEAPFRRRRSLAHAGSSQRRSADLRQDVPA